MWFVWAIHSYLTVLLNVLNYKRFNTMGGGSGGYHQPSGGGGSGGDSGDSDEDEPDGVPAPESEPEEETTEDQTDESDNSTDEPEETPDDSPPTGGGGGGAPVAGPGGDTDDAPEDDDSEAGEEETPQDDDGEKQEPESPDGPEGDEESEEQEPTDPEPDDEHEDTDSERDEQEDGQQDREEEQEEGQEDETDDEEDREEDDNDDEDDEEEEDECLIAESALLHSPNPEPLGDADEGDICSVRLREQVVCVVDSQGRTIGAIAEPWIDTLKECIEKGRQYRARILDIEGGKCEVRITNKCLLNRNVNLSSINTAVQDQLHQELSLPVEATTEEVVVVTADGSRVGNVPNPWAELLSECMDQGQSYKAEVRDITPDSCTVNIRNGSIDE